MYGRSTTFLTSNEVDCKQCDALEPYSGPEMFLRRRKDVSLRDPAIV